MEGKTLLGRFGHSLLVKRTNTQINVMLSKYFFVCLFRFRVLEVLANGGSALVEWRLETGRTHQVPTLLKSIFFLMLVFEMNRAAGCLLPLGLHSGGVSQN